MPEPRPDGAKVVVSITPLPVRGDSRTFKQASSVARFGYSSIVVEGISSAIDQKGLLFKLISISNPAEKSELEQKTEMLASLRTSASHQISLTEGLVRQYRASCDFADKDIALIVPDLGEDERLHAIQARISAVRKQTIALESRLDECRDSGNKPATTVDDIERLTACQRQKLLAISSHSNDVSRTLEALIGDLRVLEGRAAIERDAKAHRQAVRALREQWRGKLPAFENVAVDYLNSCALLDAELTKLSRASPSDRNVQILADQIDALKRSISHFRGLLRDTAKEISLVESDSAMAKDVLALAEVYGRRFAELDRCCDGVNNLRKEVMGLLSRLMRRRLSYLGVRGLKYSLQIARHTARRCVHIGRTIIQALRRGMMNTVSWMEGAPTFGRRCFRAGFAYARLGIARCVWLKRRLVDRTNSYEAVQFYRHFREYVKLYVRQPFASTPKASLYYLHSFYQFPAVYVRCLRHRAKFIYDAHDFYSGMEDDEKLSHYWRHWVLPMELRIERMCMSRAAAVVTVNEGIAALIDKRFGRKAIVLRNTHDRRFETPVERGIREVVGLRDDDFLIVCVGQFKGAMAIEEAIRGMGQLPDRYHLAFLGPRYPSYDDLIRQEKAKGRIHFLPPVMPTEVVPYIRSADAGIILYRPVSDSIRNCLPNGFFQPVAAGLPIVHPALPEICRVTERHKIGITIDLQDPRSIAAGISNLGEDPVLRKQLAQNLEAARHELSWEKDEQRLRELIEELIGPPGVPTRDLAAPDAQAASTH